MNRRVPLGDGDDAVLGVFAPVSPVGVDGLDGVGVVLGELGGWVGFLGVKSRGDEKGGGEQDDGNAFCFHKLL